jgi:hypothetical protein
MAAWTCAVDNRIQFRRTKTHTAHFGQSYRIRQAEPVDFAQKLEGYATFAAA